MSYFGQSVYPVAPVSTTNQIVNINSSTTLGAGANTYGKDFIVVDPGSFTITLPAIDLLLKGQSFTIISTCATATNTIARAGTDTFIYLGATATSLTLYPGTKFIFENNGTSWLVSAESSSTGITAAQFDNSTKFATTGFVQRALGNMQAGAILSSTTTLTAANSGSVYQVAHPSTPFTVTLPAPSTVGAVFTFINTNAANVTLSTPSGNIIRGVAGASTLTLIGSDSVTIVAIEGGNWYAVGGTASLRTGSTSGDFGRSFGTPGYQRLPSGLIIQWGFSTTNSGTGPTTLTTGTVSYPLTFPTAILDVHVSLTSGGSASNWSGIVVWPASFNTSNLSIQAAIPSITSTGVQCHWMVIGY